MATLTDKAHSRVPPQTDSVFPYGAVPILKNDENKHC